MPDALILDVPVEQGLPFMSPIGTDRVDAEGELLDHVVDEVDRVLLIVPWVDLQGADPRGVIDGRVLIAADLAIVFRLQRQELHIHLDLMIRHLFGVAARVDRATPHIARQGPYPIPFDSSVNA